MKIEIKGKPIIHLSQWGKLFTGKKKEQWKKDSSAYCLADYMINKNGAEAIQAKVSALVNEEITLEKGCPEFEVRFDKFGSGRVHDLAVWGTTKTGKSVFVSVNSKVDETFGKTIDGVKEEAQAIIAKGKKTNILKRVKGLLELNFNQSVNIEDKQYDSLRYKLFYSTAGTVSVEADIHIMLILVFKTSSFNQNRGDINDYDFKQFITRTDHKDLGDNNYQLTLGQKELTLSYVEIPWNHIIESGKK